MTGSAARVVRTAAIRLRISDACQSASVMLANPPGRAGAAPTLLTRISIRSTGRGDQRGWPAGFGQVNLEDRYRPASRQLVELGGGLQRPGGDARALGDEPARDRQPYSPAGAGDDRNSALQAKIHFVPSSLTDVAVPNAQVHGTTAAQRPASVSWLP